MIWGRHKLDDKHHRIAEIEYGSTISACDGRWYKDETIFWLVGEPPIELRCKRCHQLSSSPKLDEREMT